MSALAIYHQPNTMPENAVRARLLVISENLVSQKTSV
jgi:hypothetical protein